MINLPEAKGRKAAKVISSLFPDREIWSLEDMQNMTPSESVQAWEKLEQDFNEYYEDDPEDS